MCESKRDTEVKNRLLDSGRRREWDDLRESTETCVSPCVTQIASPGSMHEAGRSGPVHWDDPEGWDEEGGAGKFRMGDTCTLKADSCQCMANTTIIL